jgi:hypothetical protein
VATRKVRARVQYSVKDQLDERAASAFITRALAGGATLDAPERTRIKTILWRDLDDEVLVHLDSVVVRFVERYAIVSVDLETEQTGRASLIVTLAFGTPEDAAGLVAATDALPRGNPVLAARWGRVLQETVWTALLDVARTHAEERNKVPLDIRVLDGRLRFGAAPALALGKEAKRVFDTTFPKKPIKKTTRDARR